MKNLKEINKEIEHLKKVRPKSNDLIRMIALKEQMEDFIIGLHNFSLI